MKTPLTDEELALLHRIATAQEEEMVSFCIELDLVPDEPFDIDTVLDTAFERLVAWIRVEGLPLTKYDADDLSRFGDGEIAAFAAALGVKVAPKHTKDQVIDALIAKMKRVGRKLPRRSQIPMMLPYFLPALVRHFSGTAAE